MALNVYLVRQFRCGDRYNLKRRGGLIQAAPAFARAEKGFKFTGCAALLGLLLAATSSGDRVFV